MKEYQKIIINKAREFLKTPYHHQSRVKNAGIDCAGLVICVAKELNLSSFDITNYPKESNESRFIHLFEKNAQKTESIDLASIVLIRIKNQITHCGIIGLVNKKRTLIHACRKRGKVVEIFLKSKHTKNIARSYNFPNINKL